MSADWKTRSVGNVVTLQRGFDLPSQLRKPGTVPIITSSGVEYGHHVAKVKGPGVVTGRYGTIGDVFFVQEDFWPLNTTLYVRDFHGNSPRFVSYLLQTIDFKTHSGKSGVPGVNRNDLHEIAVALPPTLAEQEAIAEALSDADALIESLEQLLAKKRQIKKGAMQELLTGKKRLPGFSGEWEVTRLGHALAVRYGRRQRDVVCPDGKYPIFASGGEIGRTDSLLHDKPSVLVGRKGTIDNPQFASSPFWAIDTLFYTEIADEMSAKFLFYKFCMIPWRSYNEASGVPSLNAHTIENIEVKLPKTVEQTAIATILSDMDAEIAALEARLSKARQIKQGMMQELLTGRTRLV